MRSTICQKARLAPSSIKLYFRYAYIDWCPLFNFQVDNPTHATAHAQENTFQHKLELFTVAII